tara:strand:- start:7821 stop:8087 length:267 start_codon:yes stop_codon:yes gene_type:complete
MIDNIYSFYCLMAKLIQDPNTNWESLLGQELFGLLKPNFSTYKTAKNDWVFDPSWNMVFQTMAALYFSPPEMLQKYNTAIENIMEMKV